MAVYLQQTAALPKRYESSGVLFKVDGAHGSRDAIFQKIREAAGVASRAAAARKKAAGPPAGAP